MQVYTHDNAVRSVTLPLPFDPHWLNNLHDHNMAIVARDMVALFRLHSPEVIATMCDAFVDGDALLLQRATVRLHGSSASIGGIYLAHLCGKMEILVEEGNTKEQKLMLTAIQVAYHELVLLLP